MAGTALNVTAAEIQPRYTCTNPECTGGYMASCNVISLLYETIEEKTETAIDLNNFHSNNSSFFE